VRWLEGRADIRDVGERPVHDGDLDKGCPYCGDDLAKEEDAGGDFHVVPEFKVGGIGLGLAKGYGAVDFEYHDADRGLQLVSMRF